MDPTNLDELAAAEQLSADAEREEREEEIDDFRWLASDRRGRRVIYRLLDRAGVFRLSYTGNNDTFFNEGMRNVGLRYLHLLNEASPQHYATMMREAKEDAKRRKSRK